MSLRSISKLPFISKRLCPLSFSCIACVINSSQDSYSSTESVLSPSKVPKMDLRAASDIFDHSVLLKWFACEARIQGSFSGLSSTLRVVICQVYVSDFIFTVSSFYTRHPTRFPISPSFIHPTLKPIFSKSCYIRQDYNADNVQLYLSARPALHHLITIYYLHDINTGCLQMGPKNESRPYLRPCTLCPSPALFFLSC